MSENEKQMSNKENEEIKENKEIKEEKETKEQQETRAEQKVPFVHLHCHSEYSSLDGGSKVPDMPDKLKELGMASMALTDHGVMQGLPDFAKNLKAEGIKPILGLEAYLTEDRFKTKGPEKGHTWHITLLAENDKGYQNLCKISSWAFIDGTIMTFGRPRARADWNLLEEYSEGIICLTGCMAGPVMSEILIHGSLTKARAGIQRMIDIFGKDNVYGELQNVGIVTGIPGDSEIAQKLGKKPLTAEEAQKYESPHGDVSDEILEGEVAISQTEGNAILVELCKEFGIPYVATGDVHYLNEDDAQPHDAMLCIGTGQIQRGKRKFSLLPKRYHMRSYEEMLDAIKDWPEALEETVRVAERCTAEIEWGKELLPRFPLPEGFKTSGEYLRHLCLKGLEERYPEGHKFREESFKRLDYELGVIDRMGYNDYFLIVWDFINYANNNGIPSGPGRGSGAGAITTYTLDITKMDPLEHGLLFERFLNPDRVSMPDLDLDFGVAPGRGRDELIEYVRDKYNKLADVDTAVCQIVTFSKFKAKGALRDSARVLAEPTEEGRSEALKLGDRLAGTIPDDPKATMRSTWEDKIEGKQLRAAYNRGGMEEKVIKQAGWMEGLVKAYSTHAAGVIIADHDLTNDLPLQKLGDKKELETQYNLGYAEDLGLLKMDFLGLRNLDIIWDTVDKIKHVHGIEIDPYKDIPTDDAPTYEMLSKGKSIGVFQFESSGMQGALSEIGPTEFNDLTAIVSLYRPGPMAHIPTYAKRKKGIFPTEFVAPGLEEILGETYGITCIEENQPVILGDGSYKAIKDIKIGDKIASFDLKKQKSVIEECHGVRPTKYEKGLEITLGDGSKVTLTKDHKVFTSRGYVETKDLDLKNDLIATPKYIKTKSFKSLNQKWLGDDNSLAYLFGQLAGDGSLNSNTITLSTGKRENHQKILSFIEKNLNLKTKEYFHCRSWYLSLSNSTLLNDKAHGNRKTKFHKMLEDFGMKQSCSYKTVPSRIMEAPIQVKANYLAGLFDADGHIDKKRGTLVLTSISSQLLKDVKLLLLSFGITSRINNERLYVVNSQKAKEILSDKTLIIKWDVISSGVFDRTRLHLRSDFKNQVDGLGISKREFAKEYNVSHSSVQLKENNPFVLEGIYKKVFPHEHDICFRPIKSIVKTSEPKQFYGMSVSNTHNLIANFAIVKNCYQEQSMMIARKLAGFTPGQADDLRKAIGKKLHDKMAALKDPYMKGCLENGLTKQQAELLWADNEAAADYSFNKSHAACYAYLAYITAYLKCHYPEEYMAALLTSVMSDKDKPRLYLTEAKRMGLTVLSPEINRSLKNFAVVEKEDDDSGSKEKQLEILFGLNAIKGVGGAIVESVIDERNARGPFLSIYDLIRRVPKLNKGALQAFIKAGALDEFGESRKGLFEASEEIILETKKKIKQLEKDFINKVKAELDGTIEIPGLAEEKKNAWKLTALGRKGIEAGSRAYHLNDEINDEELLEAVEEGLRKEQIRATRAALRKEIADAPAGVAGIASEEDADKDPKEIIENLADTKVEEIADERQKLAEALSPLIRGAIKEILLAESEDEGLATALEEEVDAPIDKEEWDEIEKLNIERQMLGVYVSGHPLERDAHKWANYVTKGLNQLDASQIGNKHKVVGAIVDYQYIRTKAGKSMARLTLEDLTGARDLILFPDIFEGGPNELLEVGKVLYFGVQIDEDTFQKNKKDEEETDAHSDEESSKPIRLTVHEYFRWDPEKLDDPDEARKRYLENVVEESDEPVVIEVKDGQFTPLFVDNLKAYAAANKGKAPIHLIIDGERKETELTIDSRVNMTDFLNELGA